MKKTHIMIAAICALSMTACSAVVTKNETGNPIQKDYVSKIEDGSTTLDEVVGFFGAPTSETEVAGKKLLIWKNCKTSGGGGTILGFGGTSTTERCNTLTVNINMASGVVINHNYQKMFED